MQKGVSSTFNPIAVRVVGQNSVNIMVSTSTTSDNVTESIDERGGITDKSINESNKV
jgi:hypothetical protein